MNCSAHFVGLQTPSWGGAGSRMSARRSWSGAAEPPNAVRARALREASPHALSVDLQRRRRVEDSHTANQSAYLSRDYASAPRTPTSASSSLYAYDDPAEYQSVDAVSPLSELHAVRILLQRAQHELERLTRMESSTSDGTNRRAITRAGGSVTTSSVPRPSPPPLPQRRQSLPTGAPHRSRLERLAEGIDRASSSPSSSPSSSSASSSPRPHPVPHRPGATEALHANAIRSASYFSAVSPTVSSSSPSPSPLPSPLARPKEAEPIGAAPPETACTAGCMAVAGDASRAPSAAAFTDDTLDRYERYYREKQRLEQVRMRRTAKPAVPAGPAPPPRHPGPHPSVHALRRLASPHPTAPSSGGSEGGGRLHSLSPHALLGSHEDADASLLEQVQQWPQQLRRRSTDSSTDSDVLDAAPAPPPHETPARRTPSRLRESLPLYDPLCADSPAGSSRRSAEPRHSVAAQTPQLHSDEDDAAYLSQLRDHMVDQRAEWLRVHQRERMSFTTLLRSPRLNN